MELDHVLIACTDLDAAAREFEARVGLSSVEGGRHRDWGTANRIVPLGSSYLELVTVVDQARRSREQFRAVGRRRRDGSRTADRLGRADLRTG